MYNPCRGGMTPALALAPCGAHTNATGTRLRTYPDRQFSQQTPATMVQPEGQGSSTHAKGVRVGSGGKKRGVIMK